MAVALGVIGGSVGCCDALVGGWGTAAQKAAQRCCGVTGDSERDCEAPVGMQGAERHSWERWCTGGSVGHDVH